MFVFSSKFEAILIMLLLASRCIEFDIFEIFLDWWLLMRVQQTNRQKILDWFIKISKIFLNFDFFFRDDFLLDIRCM
jgi:hypothetical protein